VNHPLVISRWAGAGLRTIDDVAAVVDAAAMAGFAGVWVPQTMSLDALTALAVVSRQVPDIAIGTAVVPIQGRHPMPLAQQAITTALAAGPGRFTLGVGVTHRMVSEGCFGVPYRRAASLCEEELIALNGLLGPTHATHHDGRWIVARAQLDLPDVEVPIVVAALGPRMVEIAGRLSDGTVTWMTGPRSLGEDIVPALRRAADLAGRRPPRVIAGLPVCVTDDVGTARERLRPALLGAMALPSYARMMAREQFDDPTDLGLIGDEAQVTDRIAGLAALGVSELLANVVGLSEEQERTARLLCG